MSFHVFILWVVLNAAPPHVTSFIMTSPESQAVEYAKQADGGWKTVTTNPRANSTVYFTKTELTIAPAEGKRMSFPAAETMGLKGDINWQTVESLSIGRGLLKIQRQADGFDFSLGAAEPQAGNQEQQKYTVCWKETTDKSEPKKGCSDEVIFAIEPPVVEFDISKNPETVIAKGTWLGCDEPINTSVVNADRKKKKIGVTTSWIVVNQSPPKKSLALQHRDFEIVKWTEEVIVAKWSPNAKLAVQIIIDLKRKTVEQRSDGVAPSQVWKLGDGAEQFKTFFSESAKPK